MRKIDITKKKILVEYSCLARFNGLPDRTQIRKQFLIGFLFYIMSKVLGIFKFSHRNHNTITLSKYLKFTLIALFFLAFFSSSALALQKLITQEVLI